MIGLCTDSNSQLTDDLVARFDIEVVPLTVSLDGRDLLEGVDLDGDRFYACFEGGHTPAVTTAAPSPGRFADAYQRLADRGAEAILSVHVGSALSGTLNAARLAAEESPVPVTLVDTETASFAVGCAVWSAAEALASGAAVDAAADVARRVAASCGNVFVVGTLELARAGGRLDPSATEGPGVTVLSLRGAQMVTLGSAASADAAAELMAVEALTAGTRLRIAHTGPGTAGAVYHPLP